MVRWHAEMTVAPAITWLPRTLHRIHAHGLLSYHGDFVHETLGFMLTVAFTNVCIPSF